VAGTDPRAVVEAFLSAMNSRDADAFDVLLHPDYQETYPQSGERTRGAANLLAILDHYPGGYDDRGLERIVGAQDRWVATPSFTLLRIEGTGNVYTGVQKVRYSDGSDWFVVSIAEVRDERIWRVQTFFGPTFEPPAWRAPWVEVVTE
jgi:hypothetical protein